jgi:hypothetical protein
MPDVEPKIIRYDKDEEHIVRRLGLALVVQWHNLSDDQKDLLIEQATFMHDRHMTTQLQQQIVAFIGTHSQM